ncbi:MAG: SRPBCC family protein [Erythrobacter sp.]
MFGLFKPELAPEGPTEIEASIEIVCSPGGVYALLDWADERNARRATGNTVTVVEGEPGRFDMHMPMLPERTFEFVATEAVPHCKYVFGCVIRPDSGNLAREHQTSEFEDIGQDRCLVMLLTSVSLVEGFKMSDYVGEVSTMAAAVLDSMQKLKLQA